MATTFQHRRGTTSQHSSFTGAVGEITVNTTKDVAVVHDGSTAGGFEMLRNNLSNLSIDGSSASGNVIQSDGDGTYSYKSITTGKILQVIEKEFSTLYYDNTGTANSFQDVSGFSQAITPSSTSSKIMIIVSLGDVGSYSIAFRVLRNSTPINVASSSYFDGGFITGISYLHSTGISQTILDSPATTSSVTYQLQAAFYTTDYPIVINRSYNAQQNITYYGSYHSNMILMEVGP